MNRFWLGAGLLVILLGISIAATVYLDHVHEGITDTLEQAWEAALSEDLSAARELAGEAQKVWQKHWCMTTLLIDHDPVDEIDGMFAQMQAYGRSGEVPEFAACCAGVARMVEAVGESNRLTWWNLF